MQKGKGRARIARPTLLIDLGHIGPGLDHQQRHQCSAARDDQREQQDQPRRTDPPDQQQQGTEQEERG